MKKMRPRTEDDLKALLGVQLDFLKRSADAFDNGLTDEAVRLAVTLRLLLHDTANSKSLLGQLSMKNISFHDSSVPYDSHNLAPQWGLVFVAFGPKTARYAAKLDGSREARKTPFSEWWNGIVLSDARKLKITREDLILVAANQDGGAHVDTSLDETYAAFSKDGALGWKVGTRAGECLIEQPERATIRQIAHEVLKTLIPGYSCKSKAGPEFVISGVSLKAVGPSTEKKITSVAASRKIGRNEPCPCGSGKKFKKCHGR